MRSVAEAKKRGGIISKVELTPTEGFALLTELHKNHNTKFKIKTIGQTVDFNLRRYVEGDAAKPLDNERVKAFVVSWHKREYYMQYHGPDEKVSIFIVNPKKDVPPAPIMPENTSSPEYEVTD